MTLPPDRRSVVVGATLTYVLVWALGVASVFAAIAVLDRTSPTVDGDDALAFVLIVALAFTGVVVVGHVFWIMRTAKVLRPFGRVWRIVATAIVPPVSLILTAIAVNDLGVPWGIWPLVGVAAPAALSWWATAPGGGPDHDAR